ncbi:MAG TPA: A/G-specific adenine glycosylase [Paenirhodobacter sp.]
MAAQALCAWYDIHAREMPWRVGPARRAGGERPDPYRVWLSEVMLQQTTVAAVKDYFRRFTARWPDVAALAAAADAEVMAEWAGLGYYARARNLLKCARAVVAVHGGVFPDSTEGLRRLPGIGPYTAAAVAAIVWDEPAVVVDGNVERVVARLWAVEAPMPGVKPELVRLAGRLTPMLRPGDHAQAMMDLGATICTPRNPVCALCPVDDFCAARGRGITADLPRKTPKAEKPQRRGFVYVAVDLAGGVLVEQRPDKGLLGGMTGFPGSAWGADPTPCPPVAADWHEAPVVVRHTFTHFHLTLRVFVAKVNGAGFTPRADFRPAALPTVMRKVWDAAQGVLVSQAG